MKTLQKYLGVEPDGDVGPVTLAACTEFLKKNIEIPKKGKLLIGIRTDNIYDDSFPDYLCAVIDGEVKQIIHGTTTPGILGAKDYSKYNKTGVGSWKPGKLNKNSHVFTTKKNKYGAPLFDQVGPIEIVRDGDKDNIIDGNVLETATADRKFQGHMMGGALQWFNAKLGWWSLGCMGAPKGEWDKLTPHYNDGDLVSTGVVMMA